MDLLISIKTRANRISIKEIKSRPTHIKRNENEEKAVVCKCSQTERKLNDFTKQHPSSENNSHLASCKTPFFVEAKILVPC